MKPTHYKFATESRNTTEISVFLFASVAILFVAIATTSCSRELEPVTDSELPKHIQDIENVSIIAHIEGAVPDTVKLIREAVFESSDDIFMSGNISNFAVDDSDRVFIVSSVPGNLGVYMFDADGGFIRTIGRDGDGPGEFRQISSMQIFQDNLLVYDNNRQMMTRFSTDAGRFDSALRVAENRAGFPDLEGSYIRGVHPITADLFLVDFSRTNMPEHVHGWEAVANRSTFYFMNGSGELSDQFMDSRVSSFDVMMVMGPRITGTPVDFHPNLQVLPCMEGRICMLWPEYFLLEITEPRIEMKNYVLQGVAALESGILARCGRSAG